MAQSVQGEPGEYGEQTFEGMPENEANETSERLPRGTLLRRAHDLLESLGQPATEETLVRHLFGANSITGRNALWVTMLRQTLRSSPVFEELSQDETGEQLSVKQWHMWALSAWRSTPLLLDTLDFVVLDTETTGLRPGPDRIIEVAGVRVRGGEIVDTFQSLVNPRRRIPPFITKFTGISPEMVKDAPTAKEVIPDFLRFVEGATIVGHNVAFDSNFLCYEAQALGMVFPTDDLDTIMLARRLCPGLKRFKLDALAAHLNIQASNRHRAMGDASVTAAVFLRLLELARAQGIVTLEHLRRRLQLPVGWHGDITRVVASEKSERADGKLSSVALPVTRPNGSLFLNPAWKREFPTKPGVYLMRDANNQVIYVGKAKNLKNRLNSYYSHPLGYTRKMDGLLQNVKEIEPIILGSELEALLVESRLIKELQPAYNVQLRNYELYPFIKIDVQHPFARVYSTKEVAADGARYFGPFRSRRVVDLTIELVQKIFPVRTCTRGLPPQAKPSDPCLRLHLGRCSAPCRGGADAEEYARVIEQVCAFLGGEREDLLERLRRQMHEAAQCLNFERAAWFRDAIRSADEVLIGQRLITGAVEANNLFIVYPSAIEDHNELFLVRHGRLVTQRRIPHEPVAMRDTVQELLVVAASLGDAPSIVGKAEVDQINIISRWIHHHSDDRAFFACQSALTNEQAMHDLIERMWIEVDATRTALLCSQEMADTEPIEDFA
jgi:DNA polymerase-3 subunit epsilon